jgi:hypothetical protein
MTTMLADEPVDTLHARQQALQQRVLLLSPTFGCWRGYYQISKEKIGVALEGKAVKDGDTTTPRSILLKDDCPRDSAGKAWKKRFQEIERKQKRLGELWSVPFPIHGVRIIPRSVGATYFAALLGPVNENGAPLGQRGGDGQLLPLEQQSVAYQLARMADEFCSDLADIYRQIAADNPDVWEAVYSKVPHDASEMRKKFYVDAVPIELAGGAGQDVNMDELANHNVIVRDAVHRKVEEAIESMVAGPREELAEALANLQELIARDGNVTAKSFKPVHAAIAKIRLFDFVANEDLMTQIKSLERRLNITTPTTLDHVTAANNGFSAALQSVQNEINNAASAASDIQEFGRELRGIDI